MHVAKTIICFFSAEILKCLERHLGAFKHSDDISLSLSLKVLFVSVNMVD